MSEDLDILVPHYRDPEGLLKSLNSIAAQTWQGEMRVIVIDDGSPKDEFHHAERICDDFRKLKVADLLLIRNSENLGRPRTRNILLEKAEATYVAWLDSGDIWYPNKLEIQFEHILRLRYQGVNVDTVWISCAYHWHDAGTTAPRRLHQDTNGDQIHSLLAGNKLRAYLWTLLGTANSFRIAGKFDKNLPRLQDLDYFLNFLRGGGRIEVPPSKSPLCCYFKSDIGRNAKEVHSCYLLIIKKHRPSILIYPKIFRSELVYKANRLASRFALSNGERMSAMGYFGNLIMRSPRFSLRVAKNLTIGRKWREEKKR